jgi:hypothetical protein
VKAAQAVFVRPIAGQLRVAHEIRKHISIILKMEFDYLDARIAAF